MPQTKVRVVGSGFTTINFWGKPIAWLERFEDTGQRPIGGGGGAAGGGAGWEAITPIGAKYPVEIATSRVLGPGSVNAIVKELWNEPVWYSLHDQFRGLGDLTSLWEKIASLGEITMQKIITPPANGPKRTKEYHGCVITAIPDGETVTIGDLSVDKTIEIAYTHSTGV